MLPHFSVYLYHGPLLLLFWGPRLQTSSLRNLHSAPVIGPEHHTHQSSPYLRHGDVPDRSFQAASLFSPLSPLHTHEVPCPFSAHGHPDPACTLLPCRAALSLLDAEATHTVRPLLPRLLLSSRNPLLCPQRPVPLPRAPSGPPMDSAVSSSRLLSSDRPSCSSVARLWAPA